MLDPPLKLSALLLSAVAASRETGSAESALRAVGMTVDEAGRARAMAADLESLREDTDQERDLARAVALGVLGGGADGPPGHVLPAGPTCFVVDPDLVVQGADGESILRLPWFEQDLFVGRQLPDIAEMPRHVRSLAVGSYRQALSGERQGFSFTSYGHSYRVDAVPVLGESGSERLVLAIAIPVHSTTRAAAQYARTAALLERSAAGADERAELHSKAGQADREAAEREGAARTRLAAAQMRSKAGQLDSGDPSLDQTPTLTARELEVLQLASHGLTFKQISECLALSVATVKTHHQHIYSKLGVGDKAEAVAYALRHGLIQ